MSWKSKPGLAGIESVIQRWARADAERKKLHSLTVIELMHDGAVLGGADPGMQDDEKAFDECYCAAGEAEKAVIDTVYVNDRGAPMTIIAQRLGVSRTTLYDMIDEVLAYFRGMMKLKGFRF